MSKWRSIKTAPKDGRKIDLLYPEPRGRTINCYWSSGKIFEGHNWGWRTPTWKAGKLLPEKKWGWHHYPNMKPTHWMPLPEPPKERT